MIEFLNSFIKLEFDKVKRHIHRYALSDLGREHLENLTPSSDPKEIKYRLSLVTEMKQILEGDEYPPLENIFDLRIPLHRASIEDYVLPSEDLHRIALVLDTSRKIQSYFARRGDVYVLLHSLVYDIHVEKILQYNINQAIDDDAKVRDSASKELSVVRRQIREKRDSLKKSLESILKSVDGKDWIQEEIITTRDGRMVLPVKVEHKNHLPGFIHSSSASGATVFIEPTVTLELNNEIRSLEFQEQREIEKILRDLTRQVREVKDHLFRNIQILGELDFIHSRSKYSIEVLGIEPSITRDGRLKLRDAYHPILLGKHKRADVQPLNMDLDSAIHTLVITGPNAGGKSVAMKTAGLLSILMQAGCHVPVSPESEMRIFSEIFVDMGDEQSIENDLSSFSSHLKNLKLIIEHATTSSLVLIDEIGSGTDPIEGSSLAAAILERLTGIGCLTIVTTHHGSLKAFAFESPHIENGAMEFDQETLSPTYRFRAGIPGSSYAIEMAQRMKLPEDIIERSQQLKGSQAMKLEDLIVDLEKRSQELKLKLDEVNSEKEQLRSSMELHRNKVTVLESEVKRVKARAADEARTILEQANSVVEKAVREIKEKSADRKVIQSAKDEIRTLKENVQIMHDELSEGDIAAPAHFNVGDRVQLKNGDSQGVIASKLDETTFLVLIGGMKVKIRREDLVPIAHHDEGPRRSSFSIESTPAEVKSEVDLRGMFGDEAISAVEKVLDNAIVQGLHRIDIIHGKGTGALRKKVTEFLKNNRAIKSYRLGEWN